MTYATIEASVDDGNIIELYTITTTATTYRYTSYQRSVTVGANLYLSTPIKRNTLESRTSEDKKNIELEMPITTAFIQEHAFSIPSKDIDIEIARVHTEAGTPQTVFKGQIASFSIAGRIAKVIIPSLFTTAVETPFPNVYYQGQCNHLLYGQYCGLARGSYSVITQPNNISNDVITVDSVGGAASQTFKGGDIIRNADGERRLIVDQTGTVLTVNYPFRTLNIGDTVDIAWGCDRAPTTCRDKFSNMVNFGGHNLIPPINIFNEGLK